MGVCTIKNKTSIYRINQKNVNLIQNNLNNTLLTNEPLSSNRNIDEKDNQNDIEKNNKINKKLNQMKKNDILKNTIEQNNDNQLEDENKFEEEKEKQEFNIKKEIEGIFIGINIGSLKTVYSKFSNFNKNYFYNIFQSDCSKQFFLSQICYTKTHRLYSQIAEPYISKNITSSYNNLSRLIGFKNSHFYQNELLFMFNQVNSIEEFSFNFPKNNKKEILNSKNVLCDYLNCINKFLFNNNNEFNNIINFTICVPDYYTLYQKQELSLICEILDMKNYNIINESSAITIYYGYKQYYNYFINNCEEDLSQTDKILFIDFGNSKINYVISSFKKNEFKVEKVLCNPFLGGRNLDQKIFDKVIEDFINEHNIETLNLTPKKRIELLKAISKARNNLSLNEKSKIEIFSLFKNKDLELIISKEELDDIISDDIDIFEKDLSDILKGYENNIKYVEMYGNVMRTLIIESLLKEKYNFILQKSIITDECLSTGASILGFYKLNNKNNTNLLSNFIEYNYYNIYYCINDELKGNIAFEKGIIKEYEKKINLPINVDIIKIKFFYDKKEINDIGLDCINIIEYEINFESEDKNNNRTLLININLNEPKIEINNKLIDISINKTNGFLNYKNDKDKIINDIKQYLKENDDFESDYYDYLNERNKISQDICNIMINSKKKKLEIDEKQLNKDLKFLREHEEDKNIRKEKINEISQRITEYYNILNKNEINK